MKTIHTCLLFLLMVSVSGQCAAQTPYQMSLINPVALGLRLSPDGAGLTSKVFIARDWVIEADVSGSQGGMHLRDNDPQYGGSWTATVLGEYHIIFGNPSWRIYAGAGMHAGKWDKYNHATYSDVPRAQGIFGFDGIAGVEYLFKDVPIAISADIKPAVNIDSYQGFFPNNLIGVSLRYYLGRKVVIEVEGE